MGMDAKLIGIGKFSKEIEDCLPYAGAGVGGDFYDTTREGAIVFAELFHCNTTDQSQVLAFALGISAWDFNTHSINYNIRKIKFFISNFRMVMDNADLGWEFELDEEIERLRVLMENGFSLMYLPNG